MWKFINMSWNWPNHKELLVNEACLDVIGLDENSLHRHRNNMAIKYDTMTSSCLWSFSLNITLWVLTNNRYCWGPISMILALNRQEPIDCPVHWCMCITGHGWKVIQKCIQPGALLVTWINFQMHSKGWDEITYSFPNFNGATVEVWEWINNFIPEFIMYVIIYPCWD